MVAGTYEEFCRKEIERTVRFQEDIDLDVLVHGEFERADMVEYFGEQSTGFAFTAHGWVQSYGTRCVKPPMIFGDVSRAEPMTVRWSQYAQSLTSRPMKGMLTGPGDDPAMVVRARRSAAPRDGLQIALAIRDEVADLERGGHRIIQIDEPALREGLPLRRAEWAELSAVGRRRLPPGFRRRARRDANPHAHVLLASSTTSSSRSPRWMPT